MTDGMGGDVPRMSGRALLGLGIGGVACFNFIAMSLLRSTDGDRSGVVFLGGIVVGVFAAEFGLATLWLVFGAGQFWKRLALHWVVGLALVAAWALGFAAAVRRHAPPGGIGEVFQVVFCALPIIALSAQLPLWIMRIYSGWRIVRPGDKVTEARQPLAIRDLLAGMALTGVTLAALRLLPEEFHRDPGFWLAWGIAVVSIVGASALSLLPAIVMVLRIREAATAGLTWFAYAGAMLIAALVVFALIAGSGPPGEAVVAGFVAVFTFAGVIAVPLFSLRSHGYRLLYSSETFQPVAEVPAGNGP